MEGPRPAGLGEGGQVSRCVAALLVAIAACGSDKPNSSPSTAAAAAAVTTTAADATSTAATTVSSDAGTVGSGAVASDGSVIKLGYLGPQSGALASTFAAQLGGIQTYVKYWNGRGGVNGHQLDLEVYDSQSNPSTVLASARKAVGDGVQVIISSDVYFDSAALYLAEQKIPVFGSGITPGFYGRASRRWRRRSPASSSQRRDRSDWTGGSWAAFPSTRGFVTASPSCRKAGHCSPG
jgi:hypothetical protein